MVGSPAGRQERIMSDHGHAVIELLNRFSSQAAEKVAAIWKDLAGSELSDDEIEALADCIWEYLATRIVLK